MGKLKQFLLGALTGAGAVFLALQYHFVQTHQGFRMVPRTPQHSIGLAFADIRNWDAAKWTDRPELARALVANGSTDLVAGSVADGLMDSVSSGSPIDQLRGFLNQPSAAAGQGDPLFNVPGFLPIKKDSGETPDSDFEDLFSTPFPLDARKSTSVDAVEQNHMTTPPRTTVAQRPNLDLDDVFTSGRSSLEATEKPVPASMRPSIPASAAGSSQQEIDEIEKMLFGDTTVGPTASGSVADSTEDFGMFEDITSTLENRASEAMRRAAAGVRSEADQVVRDSGMSIDRYVRGQEKAALPESVARMFREDDIPLPDQVSEPAVPNAIQALQNGFDPFLE